ncbi:MAG: uracil-DNA glycosylase [Myxococcales bacterium]|nr:uracil-DNA glycosylase [Myxococcales bacterium]
MSDAQIEASWKAALHDEFAKPYMRQLSAHLKAEKAAGKVVYPPGPLIFNAFASTPIAAVKVVILGQDPYHNPGEAMGLSFSVPRGKRIPPSLLNIYKELGRDLGVPMPTHGDLTAWAQQGVFLLNAMLTVQHNAPQSHQKIGWQTFTDEVIATISRQREHVVFMLWGGFARKKRELIDARKHLVLEAAHPSPLAGGAFSGCLHFSQANAYLAAHGATPIDWALPA